MPLRRFLPVLLPAAALVGLVQPGIAAAEPASAEAVDLITIETSDKPLDVVLQWLSRRAGVNLVSNETDLPKVTIRLINVTWQEAVEHIAIRYGFVVDKKSDRVWYFTKPPKVGLEFYNAQLPVVLEALARQAGVNIVISDAVDSNKRLTMKLSQVPWREALDVVVKTTGFVWIEQDYNIIRVVDPKDVQKDLQTRVYRLNYTPGDTAKELIKVALSDDGEVSHDVRTNSLVLTDTEPALVRAFAILDEVDRRTRQVQIEMKFVEFNTSDAMNFGFGGVFGMEIDNFGVLETSFLPLAMSAGRYTRVDDGVAAMPDLPTSTKLNLGQLTFEAVQTLNSTEIIQSPTILTLNNEKATLKIVNEIRFAEETVTSEDGAIVRSLQEAESSPVEDGITIEVTPNITNDGFVTMKLKSTDKTNEFRTFTLGENSIDLPQLANKEIETNLMVEDGDTAVIGGLLKNTVNETIQKIPLLGDIPVLGWLFKNKDELVEQRNLTVFITPRIMQMTQDDDLEAAKILYRERISGLKLRPVKDEDARETEALKE